MNPDAAALAALRDIHVPPPPAWWPPATGWWLVVLLMLAVIAWRGWQHWSGWLVRRRLLDLLDELALASAGQGDQQRLIRLSRLLRQIALRHFPRAQVASLTGADWLAFLDASGGAGGFSNGPGRVLADGPYQRRPVDGVDWPALVELVRGWLVHLGGQARAV